MKKTIWWLLLLALCGLLLISVSFAAGSSYTKELMAHYVGVQLVVEGVPYVPKDANGNIVEPFIVEGTTYLPVRAVAEALGKEVSWNGDTKTVYIWSAPNKGENLPVKSTETNDDSRPQRRASAKYALSFGQYQIEVPTYWVQDTSYKNYRADAESGEKLAMLVAYSNPVENGTVSFKRLDTEEKRNKTIQNLFASMDVYNVYDCELISTDVIETDVIKGVLWCYQCRVYDMPAVWYTLLFPSEENNHWACIECAFTDNTVYRYDDCISEIISSIKKDNSNENNSESIRPEIKELLDSYEAFIDEYIAFMQQYLYGDSEDLLAMLSDYYDLIMQLEQFEEKVNALDESDLTTTELAYYLEIMNRVNRKLLSIAN